MRFDGPVLVIAGPLIAATVALLISRWQRFAVATGVIATWLLWAMVKAIPLVPTEVERANRIFSGDTLTLLGRPLLMTEGIREFVLFLYLATSILFLLAMFSAQGRFFVSSSLAALSPLAAALMIEPFTAGALLLLLALTIMVTTIQGDRAGATRAALRLLFMASLATPLFLVAGWILASDQTTLFTTAARLLAGGFVILMAGFPAFFWVRPVVVEAPPLASLFIFGLAQSVIVTFFFDLLQANAWLQQNETFVGLLLQSGAATMLVAGILALTAKDLSSLLAYCLLLDVGMLVTAVAVGGAEGWDIAVALQLARFVSLLLATVGIGIIRNQQRDEVEANDLEAIRYAPLGVALFAFGSASLIGLPMTIGFSGRWSLIIATNSASSPAWLPYLMLLAMIGASIGLLGKLVSMLNLPGSETDVARARKKWRDGLALVILSAGIWFAAFPQALHGYARVLSELFP